MLKELMRKNNLSQAQVATMCGLTQPAVSMMLSGKRPIPKHVMAMLTKSAPEPMPLLPFKVERRIAPELNFYVVYFYFFGQDPATGKWYNLETHDEVNGPQQLTPEMVEIYEHEVRKAFGADWRKVYNPS